jgi:hypothetical protein
MEGKFCGPACSPLSTKPVTSQPLSTRPLLKRHRNLAFGAPTVPTGMKITAIATGLETPRSLYTLPNGDVLVIESRSPNLDPVTRPKNIVMHSMESFVTSAGKTSGSNRITLLRDTHGNGTYDLRTVFIDHLYSPFGVALVGNALYVANTNGILRFPYTTGATSITEPGTLLTPLPGGPSTTTGPKACSPAKTARNSMPGSDRTATLPLGPTLVPDYLTSPGRRPLLPGCLKSDSYRIATKGAAGLVPTAPIADSSSNWGCWYARRVGRRRLAKGDSYSCGPLTWPYRSTLRAIGIRKEAVLF